VVRIVRPGEPIYLDAARTIPLSGVVEIETVKNHTCALSNSGFYCWGTNDRGQLARDPSELTLTHVAQPINLSGSTVVALGVTFDSTYVVTEPLRRVHAWGYNHRGQLGVGYKTPGDGITGGYIWEPQPVLFRRTESDDPVPLDEIVDLFRSDGSDQCGLVEALEETAGTPFVCWGGNDHGELGYGTLGTPGEEFYEARPAVALRDFPTATQIAHGEDFACMVGPPSPSTPEDIYDVWCWGRAEFTGNAGIVEVPGVALPPQLTPRRVDWILPAP
jgi:alpha-tubulin suppressor-like RCC1 family protein